MLAATSPFGPAPMTTTSLASLADARILLRLYPARRTGTRDRFAVRRPGQLQNVARSEKTIAATPQQVWDVLADPESYGHWVVGSKEIREWDPAWPTAGTRFHHRVGFGPLTIADHTEVVEADEPRLLVLKAKARPMGVARVEMHLRKHRAGTLVTMIENPDGLTRLVFPPPAHLLVRLRNGESLRRLRQLCESR
jgi:uncharacterized protein YndB with AHSA1/START domain